MKLVATQHKPTKERLLALFQQIYLDLCAQEKPPLQPNLVTDYAKNVAEGLGHPELSTQIASYVLAQNSYPREAYGFLVTLGRRW